MSDQIEHPGWTIKFADGLWLSTAHGWCGGTADMAYVFPTKEEAQQLLEEEKWEDGQVMEAWEPLVARLRAEIAELKKANTFSPRRLWDTRWALEEIRSNLDDVIAGLEK